MPTPAETSQESVPTCVVDWASAGEAASAAIVSAAVAEAAFRKATNRIVISRTPKSRRDLRGEERLAIQWRAATIIIGGRHSGERTALSHSPRVGFDFKAALSGRSRS